MKKEYEFITRYDLSSMITNNLDEEMLNGLGYKLIERYDNEPVLVLESLITGKKFFTVVVAIIGEEKIDVDSLYETMEEVALSKKLIPSYIEAVMDKGCVIPYSSTKLIINKDVKPGYTFNGLYSMYSEPKNIM